MCRCQPIHAAVDHFLFVLSGCRHFWLLADGRPLSCECRMAMDFHLILEDQHFVGIGFNRFFLSLLSWRRARS